MNWSGKSQNKSSFVSNLQSIVGSSCGNSEGLFNNFNALPKDQAFMLTR